MQRAISLGDGAQTQRRPAEELKEPREPNRKPNWTAGKIEFLVRCIPTSCFLTPRQQNTLITSRQSRCWPRFYDCVRGTNHPTIPTIQPSSDRSIQQSNDPAIAWQEFMKRATVVARFIWAVSWQATGDPATGHGCSYSTTSLTQTIYRCEHPWSITHAPQCCGVLEWALKNNLQNNRNDSLNIT